MMRDHRAQSRCAINCAISECVQPKPPNSQITRIIGSGIPIIHSSKPRPISYASRPCVMCRSQGERGTPDEVPAGRNARLTTILSAGSMDLTEIKADLREKQPSHASTNTVEHF
jgi:hypothetical protein